MPRKPMVAAEKAGSRLSRPRKTQRPDTAGRLGESGRPLPLAAVTEAVKTPAADAAAPAADGARMALRSMRIWARITRQKLLEFIRFESKAASALIFLGYCSEFALRRAVQGEAQALRVAGKMFRHAQLEPCRRFAAHLLVRCLRQRGAATVGLEMHSLTRIDAATAARLRESVVRAQRPFDRRLLILSPPRRGERGVMLVKFTENFKYLPVVFSLERLMEKYLLVLEPSFAGYFDEDLLCLMGTRSPILVQASEKVDHAFLSEIRAGLVPVDLGANCWVDDRVFFPVPECERKYDVIVVALWADFKRHYHLFEALSRLPPERTLKVALVGTPWPRTRAEIEELARYYGVMRHLQFFETLSQPELNRLLSQSKVALLLSRKEGFNKSIVEAMHANVPAFLLQGFNYGYRYPYINDLTGGFVAGKRLSQFLSGLDAMLQTAKFSPAVWVRQHMSAETSTKTLAESLRNLESSHHIRVNKEIVRKVNNPDCDYYDPRDWQRLAPYYRDLSRCLKPQPRRKRQ